MHVISICEENTNKLKSQIEDLLQEYNKSNSKNFPDQI